MPPPLEIQLFFKEIVLPIVRETGKEIFLFIVRETDKGIVVLIVRETHTQCGHAHVSWHAYGGQKTTFRNKFSVVLSPSPSSIGLGITQVFRFGNKCLYPLSHFTSSRNSTLDCQVWV